MWCCTWELKTIIWICPAWLRTHDICHCTWINSIEFCIIEVMWCNIVRGRRIQTYDSLHSPLFGLCSPIDVFISWEISFTAPHTVCLWFMVRFSRVRHWVQWFLSSNENRAHQTTLSSSIAVSTWWRTIWCRRFTIDFVIVQFNTHIEVFSL